MNPAPTVFDAFFRRTGEDRVTEVFATVLDGVRPFVDALAERAGLARAAGYEIETQVSADGVVIDLQVRGLSLDGAEEWVLWSEHKRNDPLTIDQLERERDALAKRPTTGTRKLIAITLYAPALSVRQAAKTLDVPILTWGDVLRAANDAGVAVGGQAWRLTAQRGDAEGARRLLVEWFAFCRHEIQENVVDPLRPGHVEILREAEAATETLEHLLELAFTAACESVGAGTPKEADAEWHAGPPADSLVADLDWKLYARWDVDDSWAVAGREEPALVVGAWAESAAATTLRKDPALLQYFGAGTFSFFDEPSRTGGWLEVARTLPLRALAEHDSLDQQELLATTFATEALRYIAAAPR